LTTTISSFYQRQSAARAAFISFSSCVFPSFPYLVHFLLAIMASSKLGLRLAPRACAGFGLSINGSRSASIASRKPLSSLAAASTKPSKATAPFAAIKQHRPTTATVLPRSTLQLAFRRSYASDAPEARLSPAAKPKKRFRILRWLWRITYLSALGFLGYVGYQIWYLRNPTEQFEPDPKKKTLVILGMSD
jgi:hypothetical protein